LVIFDDTQERILDITDYDIEYQWLNWDGMAADTGIIIQYDLHITPELAQEWIIREISRFLNQMRKDANFAVEKKASCQYHTDNVWLQIAITERQDFLIQEALLSDIAQHKAPKGTHIDTFSVDEWSIIFALSSH
jgi:hypothetical protein